MQHRYIVHCDGAAAPTNPGPSSIGVTLHTAENLLLGEVSKFLGHGTNQTAELNAAIHGLQMTPIRSSVLLVSDSQYVLKGLTEWRAGWEARGWRNSQKKPVANKDLWVQLFHEYDMREVECQWVRGHSGNVHNERCDELATAALIKAGAISSADEQPGSEPKGYSI